MEPEKKNQKGDDEGGYVVIRERVNVLPPNHPQRPACEILGNIFFFCCFPFHAQGAGGSSSSVGLDGACALTYAAFVGALLALGAAFAVAIVALDGAISSARWAVLHGGHDCGPKGLN